jgi:hypothetical protein
MAYDTHDTFMKFMACFGCVPRVFSFSVGYSPWGMLVYFVFGINLSFHLFGFNTISTTPALVGQIFH